MSVHIWDMLKGFGFDSGRYICTVMSVTFAGLRATWVDATGKGGVLKMLKVTGDATAESYA